MDVSKLEEFCSNWLNAWTGNNPELLLQFYSDGAFYQDPANPKGLKGYNHILTYFHKLLSKNPEWIWKLDELYPTPKGFILKWNASIPIGKEVVYTNGMDIVELEDEKICRNEVYFDRTEMLLKLGLLKMP